MYRRQAMVLEILRAFAKGLTLFSMESKDQVRDQDSIIKMLKRRGESVRVAKDPDGERLWIKKK